MDSIPISLETERLILRPLTLDDAETTYNTYIGDPEVGKYTSWLPLRSLKETRQWLREIEWGFDSNGNIAQNNNYIWGFVFKENGELFGSGGVIWNEKHGLFEIGYNIAKTHWNKGYTTEAARAFTNFAFANLGVMQLFGEHAKLNPASGKVMEKLGFVYQKDAEFPRLDGTRVFESREYLLYADEKFTKQRIICRTNALKDKQSDSYQH